MTVHMTVGTHMLGDRCVGQFVGTKTLGSDETIGEAIRYGYVVGKKEAIGLMAKGVLKAMSDGVAKDGDGRKIDEFFSLQPSVRGRLEDACDPFDAKRLRVTVNARMLKELRPDTSGWTFVVEGATGTFVISSVSTGEKTDEVVLGEPIAINGTRFDIGDGFSVAWACNGKSGTVDATKMTGDATRITLAADAIAGLAPEDDGLPLVITLRIGGKKAVKGAIVRING